MSIYEGFPGEPVSNTFVCEDTVEISPVVTYNHGKNVTFHAASKDFGFYVVGTHVLTQDVIRFPLYLGEGTRDSIIMGKQELWQFLEQKMGSNSNFQDFIAGKPREA